MQQTWSEEHERYLGELKASCDQLSKAHREGFRLLKHRQRYYRIPSIILGTVSGSASFGTQTFPKASQSYVPIAVGVISLTIAIIQSLEAYYKIGERMAAHLTAAQEFQKLSESIHLELALVPHERSANGINFVRGCYELFERNVATSPYLKMAETVVIQQRRRSASWKSTFTQNRCSELPMIHIQK